MKNLLVKLSIIFSLIFCTSINGVDALNNEEIKDSSKEKKIIYLTFDDGPSVVTNDVLDILKENNVKATFFLIGNQIKGKEDIVKRIQNEGHGIGLHTYTHKFKKIYASNDAFINEMLQCQDEVYRVTGERPKIIRFPGGSVKRLTKEFKSRLDEKGFKVYDWNIDSGDGIRPKTPPDKLLKQATHGNVKSGPIILLMHCDCMQKNSCKALPSVIKFYKDKGYEFKVIVDKTPECYFPIRR
ncbi:polysaccharide deacetylase family protein [Clostridium niameyense]|uniref:polysaccharide deacetylase family protein n=1 Tax=Clostridium niameyense TaxID=1622073 RepID=UPI00067EBF10|nr:polysaccharide deacetylase family protein [Clostridium niameyense]